MGGIRLLHSLRAQIASMLVVQLALFSAIVGFTLYELSLRKHDYIILNLSGRLQVISQQMANQSLVYTETRNNNQHNNAYDSQQFRDNLQISIRQFDTIIHSFQQRNLGPELTGKNEPLYCSWDERSLNQLDLTANTWMNFRDGLLSRLGEPAAEIDPVDAARYTLAHQADLLNASTNLSHAFREMMEDKLALISRLNMAAIVIMVITAVALLTLLLRKVFRPIEDTVDGFKKIAQGDFHCQLPASVPNEIGDMISSFNNLSNRLSGLFKLTQRINMATTPQENFAFLSDEFEHLLPFDWIGMLCINAVSKMQLHYQYANGIMMLPEKNEFMVIEKQIIKAVLRQRPVIINNLYELDKSDEFVRAMQNTNLRSMIILPLSLRNMEGAMMIFASVYPDAYNEDHIELMTNIALMLTHSFEKARDYQALITMRDTALGETRAKNAFLSNISHEIRRPLASVSGYTEMLLEKMRDNRDSRYQKEMVYIHTAVEHLLKMTGNILDLSAIEAEKMEFHMENNPVSLMLDVASTIARPLMKKNNNKFTCEIPDDDILVSIDRTRFNQVILTLLSNAAKYTSNGLVSIKTDHTSIAGHEYVNIHVEDTGSGMSEAQLGRLFLDYTNTDIPAPSKFEITGLGLVLCQRLVHMMGGELYVQSKPGVGSRFTIRLPMVNNCKELQKTVVA